MSIVYKDYFNIDENYFPCVNESAINAGLKWDDFYPHSTFIDLIGKAERILSRSEKRSLWISGAYGTGKSYAAFTLSQLLTSSNSDVEAYFDKYEVLNQHKTELMQRLIATKGEERILTCYRYASSSIYDNNDLIIVVQDLIAKSVEKAGLQHTGANTLKQGILKWLEDDRNKQLFSGYVEKEYKDLFGGWNTDEIIDKLKNSNNPANLMSKINRMANEIGILAIKLDMDDLIAYIKDIITGNNLKALIFVMDEFSEFFQNNRGRLTDFQKLVETCMEVPFYLIVVAHEMGNYFHERDTDAKKIKDRFIQCEIAMPDDIAFDLMHDALKIKDEAIKDWESKLDDLQNFTRNSRNAVSELTGIKQEVLTGILPLHPMSALLLKHISNAFESNQRSMFDFIKSDGDYKAFQWFIDNYGPYDGTTAFLTVDMLWDFFYQTGRDNLTLPIRNILDTYKKAETHKLVSEERQVLKTILIMQAVSMYQNDQIPLFITNQPNLDLCFEGTDYEHRASSIAEKLVRKEILYKKTLGENESCYAAMVMASDAVELDKKTADYIDKLRTFELCQDEMKNAFKLKSDLKMRYNLTFADYTDITKRTNRLINSADSVEFNAIVGVAKDDNEAVILRKTMLEKINSNVPDDKNIIYIDTTPTPFGSDSIDQYAFYMCSSEMQQGKDHAAASDLLRKGKAVIENWGNKIANGNIIIYSKKDPKGKRFHNWQHASSYLKELVIDRYPHALEFTSGLTDTTLKCVTQAQWVGAGIEKNPGGLFASAEKLVELQRNDKEYWNTDPHTHIGTIKIALDRKITHELTNNSKIAISDILSFLQDEFGFVQSNLYSFITGFLLKEYANEDYRLSDEANNEKMNTKNMRDVISEGYKQIFAPRSRYREKFIRVMSREEQVFCTLMGEVFDISDNLCSSVEDVIKRVRIKEKTKRLPAWVLSEKADGIEADFIIEFLKLLNPEEGTNISTISSNIGKLAEADNNLATKLKVLITDKSRRRAMRSYLTFFEDGILISLAKDIGAEDMVISDIQKYFSDDTEGLWLWDRDTGEGQIRKVIIEYKFIKVSNELLMKHHSTVEESLSSWRERLKFLKVSYETANETPSFAPFTAILYNVMNRPGMNYTKEFYEILKSHGSSVIELLTNGKDVFAKSYALQLQGLSWQEIGDIYNNIPNGCFAYTKQEYTQKINEIIEKYKSNLAKTQLRNMWKDHTGTDDPNSWSDLHRTPILSCVPASIWNDCKRAFDAINNQSAEDSNVKFALEFLSSNNIWDNLSNRTSIDKSFVKAIIGSFRSVLVDIDEVRDYIESNTHVSAYNWAGHTQINMYVEQLAQSKYKKGPYSRVVRHIEDMDGDKLKGYMKRLVKDNVIVGIEILEDTEGD